MPTPEERIAEALERMADAMERQALVAEQQADVLAKLTFTPQRLEGEYGPPLMLRVTTGGG
jgi:hypothetical protein